jgi:hypothetical protein
MTINLLSQKHEYTLRINDDNTEYYVKLSRNPKSNELETFQVANSNPNESVDKTTEDKIIEQVESQWEELL